MGRNVGAREGVVYTTESRAGGGARVLSVRYADLRIGRSPQIFVVTRQQQTMPQIGNARTLVASRGTELNVPHRFVAR